MRLLRLARSKTAGVIVVLLSLIAQTFPVEWWGLVPSRLQIGVLALGWLASIWLLTVVCSYYVQCRLTLDDRGILRDKQNRPRC